MLGWGENRHSRPLSIFHRAKTLIYGLLPFSVFKTKRHIPKPLDFSPAATDLLLSGFFLCFTVTSTSLLIVHGHGFQFPRLTMTLQVCFSLTHCFCGQCNPWWHCMSAHSFLLLHSVPPCREYYIAIFWPWIPSYNSNLPFFFFFAEIMSYFI